MSKKNPTKGIIQKHEQKVNRYFGYEKDGINLTFTLRVDIKKELLAFIDLMEAAKKDVQGELDRIDGKGV